MTFDPNTPYNDLLPLPPNLDVETKSILKKTITARSALAELKGLGETIPNQALLIDSLILQEAKASSEIENIITTSDALFRAFAASNKKTDAATKEVLRYREALWKGYKILKNRPVLATNLFIDIVQTIKEHSGGIRRIPGTAVVNAATGKVIYTPPEGETIIRDKLKNLEDFIHGKEDIDPLIKLALIHYQFEAIHPFSDGNGRAGRIINILFLVMNGLLDLPVLYLSKAIIEQKNDYYRLLRQVTEKSLWEPWIFFMLSAVENTAVFTRERILAIRALMAETMEAARKKLPARVYSKELIELIFRQPYTKGQFVVNGGIAKRQTAAEYLKELEKIGILKPHKIGKETLYLNVKLYRLLSK
ncbi:MAG TPA: Fic family protein [Syntrophales bacterium]|nr:Fic family protein [Syntrophales bacterium]